MVEIRLVKVSKSFGENKVLNGVNMRAEDKKITVILGPSGCGKTTILRIIAGFIKADRGHVYFGDRMMDDVPPKLRNVGFVFQNLALFPHMNVYDNISFGLKNRGYRRGEMDRRVREITEVVGLSGLEKAYPDELSGGQQQRVALARALAPYPDVLLLDEPLSSLDANLREKLKWEVRRIQREEEVTTVYVTHDLSEALTIGDKILILNDGKVQQEGDPIKVYKKPKNIFVANFLRGFNILSGKVINLFGRRAILDVDGLKVKVAIKEREDRNSILGKEIVFLIRPEYIQIGNPNLENLMRGVVESIIVEGFYCILNVVDEKTKKTFKSIVMTDFVEKYGIEEGKPITFGFSPEDCVMIEE
ncbi:MAG: ABC transporter ATP-binding protein [Candidatus Asgardarchaeia archaeon]